MIKLLSMFVRYAQLPQREFARLSSSQLFSLAQLAEKSPKGRQLQITTTEESLSIRRKGEQLTLQALTSNRQLQLTSSLSPPVRFNYLGSRWVAQEEEELKSAFERRLSELISQ